MLSENETVESAETDTKERKNINAASLVPMPENDIGRISISKTIGMIRTKKK